MIGDRQRYGHLAIGLLAELSAILVVHADGMLALLCERRVVDNPRLDRLVLLDCVQLHSATFGQHFLVRRRRDTDKVQQQLVLRRRPRRSCPRRHRLHALALPGQHQPGAVVAQRPCPVRVADHARKSLHIRRKPRFAILALLEIHLALRMPKSESLQLFDSQPQRLRPSDSVRLTLFILGAIGCAFSATIGWLIAFRFLQGIGAAMGVIPRAIIRDLHTGAEATRLMSLLMLVFSVSPILAPLTGSALIVPFGWRAVFVAVGVAALIALLLVAFLLPETRPAHERIPGSIRGVFGNFGELLQDWHFLGLTFIGGVA